MLLLLRTIVMIAGIGPILLMGCIDATFRWKNPASLQFWSYPFAAWIAFCFSLKVKVEGRENLPADGRSVVYVMNHQSNFDCVPLGFLKLPRAIYYGKQELAYVPVFGYYFYAAGNILIDRADSKSSMGRINKGIRYMQEKNASLVIFPEGTRNRKSKDFLKFKKGAFVTAIKAKVDIVPIVNNPFPRLVNWKKLSHSSFTIETKVLPPISVEGYNDGESAALAKKVQATMEEEYNKWPRPKKFP